MKVQTIGLPPGGYDPGRIIYAFIFSDGSLYVGITGTSNNTGVSTPFQRLATHLRKGGNTFSILHTRELLALRNAGFRFCYSALPPAVATSARRIEASCCHDLQARGYTVRNCSPHGPDLLSRNADGAGHDGVLRRDSPVGDSLLSG